MIRNLFWVQTCLAGFQTYLNVRTTLMSLVYEKMMKLPATDDTSLGKITNFISVDIQHNKNFWYDINFLLYCPLMITCSIYFLTKEVGFRNTYVGCIILIVFMVFNVIMARIYNHYEAKQMRHKDQRLKLVADVLHGIKLVKFYGWERSMERWISKIRATELRYLRNAYFVDNVIGCTFNFSPLLATIATFYGYVIVDQQPLTPDVAFIT